VQSLWRQLLVESGDSEVRDACELATTVITVQCRLASTADWAEKMRVVPSIFLVSVRRRRDDSIRLRVTIDSLHNRSGVINALQSFQYMGPPEAPRRIRFFFLSACLLGRNKISIRNISSVTSQLQQLMVSAVRG
jgi:hypothetical protein